MLNSYRFGEWAEKFVIKQLKGGFLGRDVDVFYKGFRIEVKASRHKANNKTDSWVFNGSTKDVDFYLYLAFDENLDIICSWLFPKKRFVFRNGGRIALSPTRKRFKKYIIDINEPILPIDKQKKKCNTK